MKIREYFISVKEQLEEYIDSLQGQLDSAHAEIKEKDLAIANYDSGIEVGGAIIQELRREKVLLSTGVNLQDLANMSGIKFFIRRTDLFSHIEILT